MSKKIQRPILIIVALGIVLIVLLALIPAIVGMNIGYDAAVIEKTVQKNCNCKEVKYARITPNSETLVDDIKSGKLAKNVSMQLIDCDYDSLDDLQEAVLAILLEKDLCDTRNIAFFMDNFKGQEVQFNVNNCYLIQQ